MMPSQEEIERSRAAVDAANGDLVSHTPALGLASASYLGLLSTQFLGATNDNTLRWLVIGLGKQYLDESQYSFMVAVGAACFVLPYLLLAAPAGWLADRYSKRRVIVACKLAELAIMVLAALAFVVGSIFAMLFVLVLMGAQSALFGPSKLGSIPEMLHPRRISAANGWIGMTTVAATVIGTGVGSGLADFTRSHSIAGLVLAAFVLIGIAAAGWLASLWIVRLEAASPGRPFPRKWVKDTVGDLRILAADMGLLRVALGIMFFWSLGMLVQLNIDQFASEGGAYRQGQIFPMLAALVVGVGGGSVLAGIWSGNKIELGILPLGAGGLALFSLLLFTVEGVLVDPGPDYTASYFLASAFLVLLGISAGLFDVPLQAYLQHRSQPDYRGAILAATNFLTFAGMFVVSLAYMALRAPIRGDPLLSSRQIFLLCGALTIPVFIYIVKLIPQAAIRFITWLATHTFYRIRVVGLENLPERGGALLVANHVSWLDAVLLVAISSRLVRVVVSADLVTARWSRWLAKTMGAITIRPTPKATVAAIGEVRKALGRGELVCMFPEGEITKSGQLQSFRPGVLVMLEGTAAPAIPVYLDELWGSIFTFEGRRFFWKWPRRWSQNVSIWIGQAIPAPHSAGRLRQAVQDLGAEAVARRKVSAMILPRAMLRNCRRAPFRWKVADSTGVEMTGRTLLMRTLILRRLLLREVLSDDERYVGILIPPSAGAILANAAVTLAGRAAVNLNYTVSNDVMNACIERAGIRHVLTSRKVMAKFDFQFDADLVYLDDLREKVTTGDKISGILGAYVTPSFILERQLGLSKLTGDDELTVIFTSGSTGIPKGVVLTFHNVGSNVEAIQQVVHLSREDTLIGVLPFFHSFGFTVTLWSVLGLNIRGVYHFSPLEPKIVGKLVQKRKANLLLGTPTFLRSYLKRCSREEFASLEIVIAGAEKLQKALSDAFEEKFGVRPVEGYGTTELSPLVSVNIPPSRSHASRVEAKEGTVGRCVPGVSAKVVAPDSFEPLPTGEAGMLLIKGPNVMKGYLGQPDKTAEAIRDGWYVTGDVARIDDDGFIEITGRLSRFSKIGGEMVPHLKVEEALEHVLALGDHDELVVAVASVPDQRKGERLVVVHRPLAKSPEEIREALRREGLPNLWIPDRDAFVEVEQIPVLGTGKLDLKGLSELVKERAVGVTPQTSV